MSASSRDAYATHTTAGTATTSVTQRRRSRRGSRQTATTKPMTSAAQAPRENVKYSVVASTGTAAAATSAGATRRACATNPDRNEEAERRKQAERVPVSERLGQPVRDDGIVVRVEPIRKEARRERVAAHEDHAETDAGEHARCIAPPQHERDGERDGDVHEHALDLAQRRGCADRPEGRERDPHGERAREARERDSQPAGRRCPLEDEQHRRRDEERQRDPPPGLREIRTLARVRGGHDRRDRSRERIRSTCSRHRSGSRLRRSTYSVVRS